jgi:hypothetical protein
LWKHPSAGGPFHPDLHRIVPAKVESPFHVFRFRPGGVVKIVDITLSIMIIVTAALILCGASWQDEEQ